jgi:carboxypeptidase Q
MKKFILLVCLASFAFPVIGQEIDAIDVAKKHGLEQSQVMEIASWITDVYGPRLTGSPMLDMATTWAIDELKSWGMENVHLEEWGPFGRGWELEHFEIHAESPAYWQVLAYPKAWSPSVSGSGEVIYLMVEDEEDLQMYKGKLEGKFVLMDTIREVKEWMDPMAKRKDAETLLGLANAGKPTPRPRRDYSNSARFSFNKILWKFLEDEKPLAVLDRSYKGDLGTVFVSGARTSEGRRQDKDVDIIPQITLSVEHYNRIMRLIAKGIPTTLTMEMKAKYVNDDGMEHNIIAEITGTDLKDEVVMFGAHFDSWHTGTGATDNGAGSAVMMEAARILLAMIEETGVQPRRTLRLALWTGEEQGLFGSRGYVGAHYADFGDGGWTPQSLRPDQKKISAYYNLDNGTGKIRGIYLQGNEKVTGLFREWLEPFHDLDATTVTLKNTGGTDHLTFDGAGIPAFQFIQDPIAYSSRTHHSNMDNWDHLVEEDLKQAATIVAAFVWNTAQRDEKLPRKDTPEMSGSH